jgi:hypothetical protein
MFKICRRTFCSNPIPERNFLHVLGDHFTKFKNGNWKNIINNDLSKPIHESKIFRYIFIGGGLIGGLYFARTQHEKADSYMIYLLKNAIGGVCGIFAGVSGYVIGISLINEPLKRAPLKIPIVGLSAYLVYVLSKYDYNNLNKRD